METHQKINLILFERLKKIKYNIMINKKEINKKKTENYIKALCMQSLKFYLPYETFLNDYLINNIYNKQKHDEATTEILNYLEIAEMTQSDYYLYVSKISIDFYNICNYIKECNETIEQNKNIFSVLPIIV